MDRSYPLESTCVLLIFNEKDNIAPLVKDILKVYKKIKIQGEIILLDDGSTDGSGKVCRKLDDLYDNVRHIRHPQNQGRSWAIRTGFNEAKGKITIIMDGDRQYDPKKIPAFLKKMEEGWDVVSGNRTHRKDSWIRRFISRVYNNFIIDRGLKLEVGDQNSGFKSFDTDKARKMMFEPEGFKGLHGFILPLAAIKGMSITEISIEHFDRPKGKSYIKFYTVPFITYIDYRRFRKKYRKEIKDYGKNQRK